MELEQQAPIDSETELEKEKEKKAEYAKQYRLKRKLEMEQRAGKKKSTLQFPPYGRSIGSCICLTADICMSHGFAGKKYNRYVKWYVAKQIKKGVHNEPYEIFDDEGGAHRNPMKIVSSQITSDVNTAP